MSNEAFVSLNLFLGDKQPRITGPIAYSGQFGPRVSVNIDDFTINACHAEHMRALSELFADAADHLDAYIAEQKSVLERAQ